jgi:co-chaperonin GroES (HSP10)
VSTRATAPKSAVRDAIQQTAANRNRIPPITAEQLAELGDVALWRILVEPYVPPYTGLLDLGDVKGVDEAQRVLSKVGRVVQVGEFAYLSKTQAGLDLSLAKVRAEPGQFWLFEMYAGQEVKLVTGHRLRILNESDLLLRVKNPDSVVCFLNDK